MRSRSRNTKMTNVEFFLGGGGHSKRAVHLLKRYRPGRDGTGSSVKGQLLALKHIRKLMYHLQYGSLVRGTQREILRKRPKNNSKV